MSETFFGPDPVKLLRRARQQSSETSQIPHHLQDTERYEMVAFEKHQSASSVEEKLTDPKGATTPSPARISTTDRFAKLALAFIPRTEASARPLTSKSQLGS